MKTHEEFWRDVLRDHLLDVHAAEGMLRQTPVRDRHKCRVICHGIRAISHRISGVIHLLGGMAGVW